MGSYRTPHFRIDTSRGSWADLESDSIQASLERSYTELCEKLDISPELVIDAFYYDGYMFPHHIDDAFSDPFTTEELAYSKVILPNTIHCLWEERGDFILGADHIARILIGTIGQPNCLLLSEGLARYLTAESPRNYGDALERVAAWEGVLNFSSPLQLLDDELYIMHKHGDIAAMIAMSFVEYLWGFMALDSFKALYTEFSEAGAQVWQKYLGKPQDDLEKGFLTWLRKRAIEQQREMIGQWVTAFREDSADS